LIPKRNQEANRSALTKKTAGSGAGIFRIGMARNTLLYRIILQRAIIGSRRISSASAAAVNLTVASGTPMMMNA
jgi:hypothetical protein